MIVKRDTDNIMQPCFECDSPSVNDHHVVPQSRGGTRTVPLCASCHDKAHDTNALTLSREGFVRAVREGRNAGEPPFGFRYENGRLGDPLVPYEPEQEAIAIIRDLRQKGRVAAEIVTELNRRGMTRRSGDRYVHSTIMTALKGMHSPPAVLLIEDTEAGRLIADLRRSGMQVHAIAAELTARGIPTHAALTGAKKGGMKWTRQMVAHVLRKHGIVVDVAHGGTRARIDQDTTAVIVHRLAAGESQNAIARSLGLSASGVRGAARRARPTALPMDGDQ